MISIENNIRTYGWIEAIYGMRNPRNSWDQMDSWSAWDHPCLDDLDFEECKQDGVIPKLAEWPDTCPCSASCDPYASVYIGKNDLNLMKRLRNAGTDDRKYLRMINVYMNITAPMYWWSEFDTYKVGTVANSCSKMHKLLHKEFELSDFSFDHLTDVLGGVQSNEVAEHLIATLNKLRGSWLNENDVESKKRIWYSILQLLPNSYNQKRTVMMNYEVLNRMYKARKHHKLNEWREFCKVVETLPYAQDLITAKE